MPLGLVLIPAIIMGLLIGLIETFFVHASEAGMGWLGHAAHALPVTVIFVFISMNLTWFFALIHLNIMMNFWIQLGIRVLIGIIAMVKIAGAAAIAGRVGEKKIHVLIVGMLIIAAPYIWEYLLAGILGKYVPSWG